MLYFEAEFIVEIEAQDNQRMKRKKNIQGGI